MASSLFVIVQHTLIQMRDIVSGKCRGEVDMTASGVEPCVVLIAVVPHVKPHSTRIGKSGHHARNWGYLIGISTCTPLLSDPERSTTTVIRHNLFST